LVEDDLSMREAIERVLTAASFTVMAFESAEAALSDRTTLDAPCLVLDLHLPGLSGFEMYQRILDLGQSPPVIFITARDNATTRNRAVQYGALGYLVKPFSGHALSAVVARAFA
jgi:FixJ family two-component response regulator